jgi:outer membrane lipoprotein-sorting protein
VTRRTPTRAALGLIGAALLAGCGGPGALLGPPAPKDILAKPAHANLKDAHFKVSGRFSDKGLSLDVSGDGAVVYKAPGSARFTIETTVAGQKVTFENISVNGLDYTKTTPGNGKWTSGTSASALGPDSFAGASDYKYLGEENLAAGKAWHVSAKDKDGNPFDGWVRESDGYPLKYRITQLSNALTFTFDRYNTGLTITPPPASDVVQG